MTAQETLILAITQMSEESCKKFIEYLENAPELVIPTKDKESQN